MTVSSTRIARPFTVEYLLRYSAEHVKYEFDMFLWLVEIFSMPGTRLGASSPENLRRLQNVLVESFVIHLRNVIDFFYLGRPQPSDIVAADFFPSPATWHGVRPPISASLEKARVRANRELAHLTTDRLAGAPPEKCWDIPAIAAEIRPLLRMVVQHAAANRLSPAVAAVIR